MTLTETEYAVKIPGKFSRKCRAQKELKQGDGLSAMLFNLLDPSGYCMTLQFAHIIYIGFLCV
jgi:hypothetical protein